MSVVVIGIDPSLTKSGITDGTRHSLIVTYAGEPLFDRCSRIIHAIAEFVNVAAFSAIPRTTKIVLAVEAPMLTSVPAKDGQRAGLGAGHLYEMGHIFRSLQLYARDLRLGGWDVVYLEVPRPKVCAYVGKGNMAKTAMPLAIWRRWAVDFDHDPGADKAFAYAVYRYALAVIAGEVTFTPSAPRGQGASAVAGRRKAGAA
jgi:hypothetical protein